MSAEEDPSQDEDESPQEAELESESVSQEPWNLDNRSADLSVDGEVPSEPDPDVLSSHSIDEELQSRSKTKQASGGPDSAIDLPEIMTESYDEDPEDENALTLQQILSTKGHDNLHSELNQNLNQSVADHIAYSSLEKRRVTETQDISQPEEEEKEDVEPQSEPETPARSRWTFDSLERNYRREAEPDIADAVPGQNRRRSEPESEPPPQTAGMKNHIIMCGAVDSFVAFTQQLRRCDPISTPIVILHPNKPKQIWPQLKALGPVQFVQGNPSDADSLQSANASEARALVFLAHAHRPARTEEVAEGDNSESSFASRTAVLADAQGLLTCYGVGEDGSANLPHAVVELCFTSSVRFLQPGLLLKGQGFMDEMPHVVDENDGQPRKSWQMRKRQEKAAIKEGLAEWQANPYYCAGRVTVPALMDTFACQCFFNRGKLTELMEELAGDDGRAGGAQLRQIPLPEGFAGKTYGELFATLTLARKLLPLGLYRRKSENSAWRLYYLAYQPILDPVHKDKPHPRFLSESYDWLIQQHSNPQKAPRSQVVTNPPMEERLDKGDRIFVLRERGGPWLITLPSAAE